MQAQTSVVEQPKRDAFHSPFSTPRFVRENMVRRSLCVCRCFIRRKGTSRILKFVYILYIPADPPPRHLPRNRRVVGLAALETADTIYRGMPSDAGLQPVMYKSYKFDDIREGNHHLV